MEDWDFVTSFRERIAFYDVFPQFGMEWFRREKGNTRMNRFVENRVVLVWSVGHYKICKGNLPCRSIHPTSSHLGFYPDYRLIQLHTRIGWLPIRADPMLPPIRSSGRLHSICRILIRRNGDRKCTSPTHCLSVKSRQRIYCVLTHERSGYLAPSKISVQPCAEG